MRDGSRVSAVFTADYRDVEPVSQRLSCSIAAARKGIPKRRAWAGTFVYTIRQLGCRCGFTRTINTDE